MPSRTISTPVRTTPDAPVKRRASEGDQEHLDYFRRRLVELSHEQRPKTDDERRAYLSRVQETIRRVKEVLHDD